MGPSNGFRGHGTGRASPSVGRRFGAYTLQAAIAAIHAKAGTAEQTDWNQIVVLYAVLQRIDLSPVVELNRAVAVAMRDGPEAGLVLIDAILKRGDLVGALTLPTRREPSCADAPAKRPKRRTRMSEHYRWLGRNPSRRFQTRRLYEI